jgi:hypothetical protein
MALKEVTMAELLADATKYELEHVQEIVQALRPAYLVRLENQQMDSTCFGDRAFLCVGPNQTYKTPQECEGKPIGNLPSQRMYPVAFAKVE